MAHRMSPPPNQCASRQPDSTKRPNKQLTNPEALSAVAFLSGDQLPQVEDAKLDQPNIDKAVQAISDRVEETELAPILRTIKEDDLRRAIGTAEGNARRFESAGKP